MNALWTASASFRSQVASMAVDHLERGRPFQREFPEQRLVMDEGYIELVLRAVEQIPRGQVASYGDIAELVESLDHDWSAGSCRCTAPECRGGGSFGRTVGRFAAWRNRRSSCCDAMGHRCVTAGWTCGRLGCARRPIRMPGPTPGVGGSNRLTCGHEPGDVHNRPELVKG